MGFSDDLGNRVHRAEGVGDRHDGDQFCLRVEQLVEGRHVELPILREWHMTQNRAGPLAHLLPGHEVRVVFHHGGEHFVARPEVGFAPTAGHQVDRRRGALRENHFVGMLGMDERAHLFARLFVLFRAPLAERVDPTVDVGIVAFVHPANGVDHLPRPLRAGGVVQED